MHEHHTLIKYTCNTIYACYAYCAQYYTSVPDKVILWLKQLPYSINVQASSGIDGDRGYSSVALKVGALQEAHDRCILADLASVYSFHELPTYRSLYVACIDDTSVASTDHDLHRDKIRRHLYGIIGPPV